MNYNSFTKDILIHTTMTPIAAESSQSHYTLQVTTKRIMGSEHTYFYIIENSLPSSPWFPLYVLERVFKIPMSVVDKVKLSHGSRVIPIDVMWRTTLSSYQHLNPSFLISSFFTCIDLNALFLAMLDTPHSPFRPGCLRIGGEYFLEECKLEPRTGMNPENATTRNLTTRHPIELHDRIEEKMKNDGITTKTEAISRALNFWLDNEGKTTAPISRHGEDKLRRIQALIDSILIPNPTSLQQSPPKDLPDQDSIFSNAFADGYKAGEIVKKKEPPKQPELTKILSPEYQPGKHLSIGEFSQIYFQSFNLGRNQMFNLLRDMKIIQQDTPLPLQRYVKNGMFEIITVKKSDRTFTQAVLTPRGRTWLPKQIHAYLEKLKP